MKKQYIQISSGIVCVKDIIFMHDETEKYGGTIYISCHDKITFGVPNSFFDRPDIEDVITKHFFVISLPSTNSKLYVNKHNCYKLVCDGVIELENGFYLKLSNHFTWENALTITNKIITYIKECQSDKILK